MISYGDMVSFIINTCYGKLNYSKFATALFLRHFPEYKDKLHPFSQDDEIRYHPYMIHIVETFGAKASGSCSRLCVVHIPDKYKLYIEIEDMDGLEKVVIHFDKYKLECIQQIVECKNGDNTQKIACITDILKTDEDTLELLDSYNALYIVPYQSYEEEEDVEDSDMTGEEESNYFSGDHDYILPQDYEMISLSEV